jgi:hypothetical protein
MPSLSRQATLRLSDHSNSSALESDGFSEFPYRNLGAWLWTGFAAPPVARNVGLPMLSG